MPFKPVECPKCPKCGKSVYQAEELLSGGNSYHKGTCFKCGLCKKALDSNSVRNHGVELFCEQCYGRVHGPKGMRGGCGGGGAVNMDTGEHLGNKDGAAMMPKSKPNI